MLPTFAFDDPLSLPGAAFLAAGVKSPFSHSRPHRTLDAGEYIVDRAAMLTPDELDEAITLLREDDIFPADWTAPYLDGPLPGGGTFTLDSLRRTAVKYGWALAHAAILAADEPAGMVIAFDGTATPSRSDEHFFLASELHRLGVRPTALALRLPGHWEPAIDFVGDLTEVGDSLTAHAAIATARGHRFCVRNAGDKFSVLSVLARAGGERLHVDLSAAAWLEAMRAVARVEPPLFRDLLQCAQEHFTFHRGPGPLSVGEEEVRCLPEVADPALEATFLDDPRGRQLLHVGRRSILDEPTLRDRLTAALTTNVALYATLAADCLGRHLALLHAPAE